MMIGAMSCSSLKTSLVLEVKAAEAWVPGMLWTDVNVSVSGIILAFLGQRYERLGCRKKTNTFWKVDDYYCNYEYTVVNEF